MPASPIVFRLDAASGVPTYLQLVHQVEHALLLGYLKPGDQLPKVRDVVADLAINPNTVLKAYRELEHKGFAAGRPGQGTFIEAGLTRAALPGLAGLRRRLRLWIRDAEAAGLDETSMVAVFTTTLRDFAERRVRMTLARHRSDRGRSRGEVRREHHRDLRPGQEVRPHLGAAGLHACRPGRPPRCPGRSQRRGQDHAAEHRSRPDGTDGR